MRRFAVSYELAQLYNHEFRHFNDQNVCVDGDGSSLKDATTMASELSTNKTDEDNKNLIFRSSFLYLHRLFQALIIESVEDL